jgi:hypothetical protein
MLRAERSLSEPLCSFVRIFVAHMQVTEKPRTLANEAVDGDLQLQLLTESVFSPFFLCMCLLALQTSSFLLRLLVWSAGTSFTWAPKGQA